MISGCKTLYKVSYWGWDGQSREVDYVTGDVIESLNTAFIYAFWEDEDLPINFKEVTFVDWNLEKIESIEIATDQEEEAFQYGWMAKEYNNNSSYGEWDGEQ